MSSKRSKPINIPKRSHSCTPQVNLDNIHFSPPELRDRVEQATTLHPDIQARVQSYSMPNIKIKQKIRYQER